MIGHQVCHEADLIESSVDEEMGEGVTKITYRYNCQACGAEIDFNTGLIV